MTGYQITDKCSLIYNNFTMEYVTSNKGGVKLLYEGFVYVKSKILKSGDVSFECEMRRDRNSKQCKARLRVSGDSVVGRFNDHTHAPDIGRPEALKIRQSYDDILFILFTSPITFFFDDGYMSWEYLS